MTSRIEISSSASLLCGANDISSFAEETREAKVCSNIYSLVKRELISCHVWRFSIAQSELSKLEAIPKFGYSYVFQLPSKYIRLIGKDNNGIKHDIFEDKLYCNLNAVMINYQFEPREEMFPPYFTKLITLEMAKLLSITLFDDEKKYAMFAKEAKEQLIKARTIDSQSNGNHEMPASKFSLVTVRY